MDQIPKYQDRKDLLRGMPRNQNKVLLKGKGEFRKFSEGLMQVVVFVDHGKAQDPRIPSAK